MQVSLHLHTSLQHTCNREVVCKQAENCLVLRLKRNLTLRATRKKTQMQLVPWVGCQKVEGEPEDRRVGRDKEGRRMEGPGLRYQLVL